MHFGSNAPVNKGNRSKTADRAAAFRKEINCVVIVSSFLTKKNVHKRVTGKTEILFKHALKLPSPNQDQKKRRAQN